MFKIVGVFLFLFMFISSYSFAEFERDYITTGTTIKIRNQISTPTLQFAINADGSIRHLKDNPSTTTINRKFAVITKTGLQLENIVKNELSTATIHTRQWQLPVNASILIKQYTINDIGLPDFNNPIFYTLSATSNTIITIYWIKKDFIPYPIYNPLLP